MNQDNWLGHRIGWAWETDMRHTATDTSTVYFTLVQMEWCRYPCDGCICRIDGLRVEKTRNYTVCYLHSDRVHRDYKEFHISSTRITQQLISFSHYFPIPKNENKKFGSRAYYVQIFFFSNIWLNSVLCVYLYMANWPKNKTNNEYTERTRS